LLEVRAWRHAADGDVGLAGSGWLLLILHGLLLNLFCFSHA
jgi:hypothetical protein